MQIYPDCAANQVGIAEAVVDPGKSVRKLGIDNRCRLNLHMMVQHFQIFLAGMHDDKGLGIHQERAEGLPVFDRQRVD